MCCSRSALATDFMLFQIVDAIVRDGRKEIYVFSADLDASRSLTERARELFQHAGCVLKWPFEPDRIVLEDGAVFEFTVPKPRENVGAEGLLIIDDPGEGRP